MTTPLQQEIARIICCKHGGECRHGVADCPAEQSYLPEARAIISRVLQACEPVTEEMQKAWLSNPEAYPLSSAQNDWTAMLAAKRRELLGGEK